MTEPRIEARQRLLDYMRRMDCQDLFDDAFYALVVYERAIKAEADQIRTRMWDLELAIATVLADEESRPGSWGPDVTMVTVLKDALELP